MADSWEDEPSTSESWSLEQEKEEEQAEERTKPAGAQAAGGHTGTGTAASQQRGAAGADLTGDGGVRKLILRAAPADAPAPSKEDYVCVGENLDDAYTYGMWGYPLGLQTRGLLQAEYGSLTAESRETHKHHDSMLGCPVEQASR